MSFGITELLVILAIVVLLFGTTKLKSMGTDLGSAIKGFKSALNSDEENSKLEADVKDVSSGTTSESTSDESKKVGAGKE